MKWFNFFKSVYILKIIDFLGSKFVFQNTICRSTTILYLGFCQIMKVLRKKVYFETLWFWGEMI